MPWALILKAFLSIAGSIAKIMEQKQLLDAGATQAILKGNQDANDAIDRAERARANADSLPDVSDPLNRDNDK